MQEQPADHVVGVFRQVGAWKRSFYCFIDELIDTRGLEVFFSVLIRYVRILTCFCLGSLCNFLVVETLIEELLFLILGLWVILEFHKFAK